MKYLKENWKFLLFVLIMGIIGSIFTVRYSMSYLSEEVIQEAIKQVGSRELVMIISISQSILYAIVFGILGLILANKVGLWKKITWEKKPIISSVIVSLIGGLLLIFCDLFIFGNYNDIIKHSFDTKPTLDYIMSSFTYGGVIEEVMMRLFFMSLITFILYKIFYRKASKVPTKVFVIANIVASLLFAIGHLPSTKMIFGYIDGVLLIRCLLLNGGIGLAFGYLYQKYGISYSMLAHFGCHLISKIIWLLFL